MNMQDTESYNQNTQGQQFKFNHDYKNRGYLNVLNDYNFSKDFNNILASVEWMSKKEIPEADEDAWYFLYDLLISAKKIKDNRCIVACHELANRMKKTSGSSQMRTAILENSILSETDCVEVIECSLENGSYETAIYNIFEFISKEQNFSIVNKVLSAIDSSVYEIEISTKTDIAKRFINAADKLLLKEIDIKKEQGLFGKFYSLSWTQLQSSDVKKYLKLRNKYNTDKLHIAKEFSPRQIEKQKQKAENKAKRVEVQPDPITEKQNNHVEEEAIQVIDHRQFIEEASLSDGNITANIGNDIITIVRIVIEETSDNKLHYSVYCRFSGQATKSDFWHGNQCDFYKNISCNDCQMRFPENGSHTCKFDIYDKELDELVFAESTEIYEYGKYYISPAIAPELYRDAYFDEIYYRLKEKKFI